MVVDPIGTLTIRGQCFNIDIFNDVKCGSVAAMQIKDEHSLVWRVYLGSVKKLLENDDEYFIRLMTCEQITVRIKILDSVCDNSFPRSYFCDSLQYE